MKDEEVVETEKPQEVSHDEHEEKPYLRVWENYELGGEA